MRVRVIFRAPRYTIAKATRPTIKSRMYPPRIRYCEARVAASAEAEETYILAEEVGSKARFRCLLIQMCPYIVGRIPEVYGARYEADYPESRYQDYGEGCAHS